MDRGSGFRYIFPSMHHFIYSEGAVKAAQNDASQKKGAATLLHKSQARLKAWRSSIYQAIISLACVFTSYEDMRWLSFPAVGSKAGVQFRRRPAGDRPDCQMLGFFVRVRWCLGSVVQPNNGVRRHLIHMLGFFILALCAFFFLASKS